MTQKIPRICVVGSANMDLLSKVTRIPKTGETLVGHYFYMGCGGKGSNQAAMAAKLGAEVTICLLYTSPSPRDGLLSRMPSSA